MTMLVSLIWPKCFPRLEAAYCPLPTSAEQVHVMVHAHTLLPHSTHCAAKRLAAVMLHVGAAQAVCSTRQSGNCAAAVSASWPPTPASLLKGRDLKLSHLCRGYDEQRPLPDCGRCESSCVSKRAQPQTAPP